MTSHLALSDVVIAEADASLRERIYRARHEVYAVELGQHSPNTEQRLTDRLDEVNDYIVALHEGELAAFVSITPPGPAGYSIDKYFDRSDLPSELHLDAESAAYEIRLLTVMPIHRDSFLAATLMIAAYRWIEAHGGRRVIAIGHEDVAGLYERGGMQRTGLTAVSGSLTFELMHADVAQVRRGFGRLEWAVEAIEQSVQWRLHVPLRTSAGCFHGGASFDAIGTDFADLDRRHDIINADVLDAWFDPAPAVLKTLQQDLSWLLRTSPPVDCAGLTAAIATARGIDAHSVLPGAGSSDLIFRALPRWLTRASRVLLLDPTYGEYGHVLEQVIGCQVDRVRLCRSNGYHLDLEEIASMISAGPDLVVLVNPNSPTGRFITADEIDALITAAPPWTRVWVDETYIDYVGESVESLIGRHSNLVVCKSMSKAYALSGCRVAYLAAAPHQLEELRALTPPWVVGLVSQVAATLALHSSEYYETRWAETHSLREDLAKGLSDLGWDVVPGCANFLLSHLPDHGATSAELLERARQEGLHLRDISTMGTSLDERAVRIAVKDAETNRQMISILARAI